MVNDTVAAEEADDAAMNGIGVLATAAAAAASINSGGGHGMLLIQRYPSVERVASNALTALCNAMQEPGENNLSSSHCRIIQIIVLIFANVCLRRQGSQQVSCV